MSAAIRHVLHLGWSPVAAVEALSALGAAVTCAVEPADLAAARASPYPDRVVAVADCTSAEAVAAGLARVGLDPAGFDAVSPANELELVAASLLGAAIGAPGLPYPAALAVRDKYVQKTLVRAAGVPVTECRVLESFEGGVLAPFGDAPVVIKPLAGAGAANTFLVSGEEELAALPIAAGSPGLWLAERFVDGPELHLDGVIRQGELLDVAVSRYLHNVIRIKAGQETGSVGLRPDRFPELYVAAGDLIRRVARALSYPDGVFHAEAFLQPDGSLIFSELGGRVGGGGISVVWRDVRGVDIHEEWARCVLGLPSAVPSEPRRTAGTSGWINLRGRPGRVLAAPKVAELERQPGVIYGEVKATAGKVTPEITGSSSTRAGRAVVVGPDEDVVEARLRAVSAWLHAHIKVAEQEEG